MTRERTRDIFFMALFAGVVCLVFWKVLALKLTFIRGDYLQQFFPWSFHYARAVKDLSLPLWIRQVQCGYPVFAEGQTGTLYPLNLILFFLAPFRAAYNYSFLLHFVLSGIFTYLYARKLRADAWGAFISAILLCFGSMYAGCFINVSTLKCLSWMPLVFLLYEYRLERDNAAMVPLIGLIAGIQLLAGSFQMGLYTMFFYLVFFVFRSGQEGRRVISAIKDAITVFILAFLISSPQLIATYRLGTLSNRPVRTLDFALWNSFSPLASVGLFLPYLGMFFAKGNLIYVGIAGLFFAVCAFYPSRREKPLKALIALLLFSVFFALGKYNPVYVSLLRTSGFYSFRAPSRFIYFGVFALSVLAGRGFTFFFGKEGERAAPAANAVIFLCGAAAGVLLVMKAAFSLFGEQILGAAKEYVARNIFGKPFHRYSLESYMERTEEMFHAIKSALSFADPYTVASAVILVLAAALLFLAVKSSGKRAAWRPVMVAFVALELGFFGMFAKGIRTELAPFDHAEPEQKKILARLTGEKELFRVCPFGAHDDRPLWLRPSMNMLYGVDSAAFYSPLACRGYYLITKGLGIVDDSIGVVTPAPEALYAKTDLLKALNVKYIASTVRLENRDLRRVEEEKGLHLYELKGALPRFMLLEDPGKVEPVDADISVTEYRSGYASLRVNSGRGGYLCFSETYYPGWKAAVDGGTVPIIRFYEVLQAVRIGPGEHEVVFSFRPLFLTPLLAVHAAAILLGIAAAVLLAARAWKKRSA